MNNKASGSTILGVILFALILLTSFSYIAIYSRTSTQESREALMDEYKLLKKSLNTIVFFTLSEEGLYINVNKPPLKLVEVVALKNDGTTTYLNKRALINTTRYLLIDNTSLKNILASFDKLLILTDVDSYMLSKEYIESLNKPSNVKGMEFNEITSYSALRPYVIIGALKTQRETFLVNPVPGSLSDTEATYVPIAVVELNKSVVNVIKSSTNGWFIGYYGRGDPSPGTGVGDPTYVMGWLKYEYQPAFKINATHWIEQRYSSGLYPVNYYYWYVGTAGIYLVPVIISPNTTSLINFYFSISRLSGPTLYVKPVVFTITLESFLRSKIPVKISDVMTEPTLSYNVALAYYTWFGSTYVIDTRSQSTTFTVTANPQTIYTHFPSYKGFLAILIGFTFVCGNVNAYNHVGDPTIFSVLNIPLGITVDLNEANLDLILGLTSTNIYPSIQGLSTYKLFNLNNNPRYLGVINVSGMNSFKITYTLGTTTSLSNYTLTTLYDSNPVNSYKTQNVREVSSFNGTYALYDAQNLRIYSKNFYVNAWASYGGGSNNPNQWWSVELTSLDPDTSIYLYVELRDSAGFLMTTKAYVLDGGGSISDTYVYSGLNFAYYYYIQLSFDSTNKKLILRGGVYTSSGYAYGDFRYYVYLGKKFTKLSDNGLFITYSYIAKNFKVAIIDLNVVNVASVKPNSFVIT